MLQLYLYFEYIQWPTTSVLTIVFSIVHEVGREQGVLTISVVFDTVHEVGREQGVLTISVVFDTVHEVGREQKYYLLFMSTY